MAALALLVLAGCGDAGTTDSHGSSLDGTWLATQWTDAGKPYTPVRGTRLEVRFDGTRIRASAGCNQMSGTFELRKGHLTVDRLTSTELACSPELKAQDEKVAALLSGGVDVATRAGRLELSRGEDTTVELADRRVTAPDLELLGTRWELDAVRSGDAVSSVPPGVQLPSLVIADDHTLSVWTGCNQGEGTVTVTGRQIQVGPLQTTRSTCADEGWRRIEAAILAVLRGTVTWSIEEQSLTIDNGSQGLTWHGVS